MYSIKNMHAGKRQYPCEGYFITCTKRFSAIVAGNRQKKHITPEY